MRQVSLQVGFNGSLTIILDEVVEVEYLIRNVSYHMKDIYKLTGK